MNSKLVSLFFVLFASLSLTTFADNGITTVLVIGTASPPPDAGLIAASQNQSSVPGGNQGGYGSAGMNTAMAAKAKADAYAKCLGDSYSAKATCDTNANNNLLSNQAVCTKVGASMAGITLGAGILISLTGVGATAGVLVVGASGTAGTAIYNQCNNTAQAIFNNSKTSCENIFNQSKLVCDANKP